MSFQKHSRKILILGADGYLGHALNVHLRATGWQVIESGLADSKRDDYLHIDIRDKQHVTEGVIECEPDVVIHAAGVSSLLACEKDPSMAHHVNVVGTENIVAAIKDSGRNSKLVFISSDYVFDGKCGNYLEDSPKNPGTCYGLTKARSEDEIIGKLDDHIIIRTSNVYGQGGNFYNFIKNSLKGRKPVELYDDTFYTPTFLSYFSSAVSVLLLKEFVGIIHVAGKQRVSRYEFGSIACATLGANPSLVVAAHQEVGGLLANDSSLNIDLASKIIPLYNPNIQNSFEFLQGLKTYPYFLYSDHRGTIQGLNRRGIWREVNYATTVAGTIRGNHYHRDTTEAFFIVCGLIQVKIKSLVTGIETQFIAKKGDFFEITPMHVHTFEVRESAEWINFLSSSMDDHAPDIITV